MNRSSILRWVVALAILLIGVVGLAYAQGRESPRERAAQAPLGTAFTYQGQLKAGDAPVTAGCDLAFRLYDAAAAGSQVGAAITATVPISDGLFAVNLDFGPSFTGDARWLDIRVMCPGDAGFADLGRQELTAAPYALYALGAPWSGLAGIPAGFADGDDDDTIYSAGNQLDLAGTTFDVLEGTGSDLDADLLDGQDGPYYLDWSNLAAIPAGFADGVDDDTIYSAGNQLDLTGTTLDVLEGTGSDLDADLLDGQDGPYYLDWSNLAAVPAGFADGVDDDTTYSAGTGLNLTGTTFGVKGSYRLPQTCAGGEIAEWDGSAWQCGTDDTGAGGANWSLTGNAGTSPGTHFLGTTDAVSLTLAVSGTTALRLEPTAGTPNLVGGYSGNSVAPGVVGAIIGGGGQSGWPNQVTANFGMILGGDHNTVSGRYGTIGGGGGNTVSGLAAMVGGGGLNVVSGTFSVVGGGLSNAIYYDEAVIGGGSQNEASGYAATIGGGISNTVRSPWATLSGGISNTITVSGTQATVGGGHANVADDINVTIGGGQGNAASGYAATVGGGLDNTTSNWFATVGGGYDNTGSGGAATVGGGQENTASGEWATVGGGNTNEAIGDRAVIGGGLENVASGLGSTIAGGEYITASGQLAAVGGGLENVADGFAATVPGGRNNTAQGVYSFAAGRRAQALHQGAFVWADSTDADFTSPITDSFVVRASGGVTLTVTGGGLRLLPEATSPNLIGGYSGNWVTAGVYGATIGGGGASGTTNRVTDNSGTVGGGSDNQAGDNAGTTVDARLATVGGGQSNTAGGLYATVGGGYSNDASANAATVGGGAFNSASSFKATVGGGGYNTASNQYATVGGGYDNTASSQYATVGGGYDNTASASFATVAGGVNNLAIAEVAAVGGGSYNLASGQGATVPGGENNTAQGDNSFAAGQRARANNQGCFVWGDSTNADVSCFNNDRWIARASGGVFFYTNSTLSSGMYLSAGGSAWNAVSDRARKENLEPVDTQELLDRLAAIQISTWNYLSQDPSIRHIGPMAQDFNALLPDLGGEGETTINSLDADGVALAAIQGLYQQNQQLEQRVNDLEARLAALEAGEASPRQGSLLPWAGVLLAGVGLAWVLNRDALVALIKGEGR